MSLLYSECTIKDCVIFKDDQNNQMTIGVGNIVKIKGCELYNKKVQIIGKVNDLTFDRYQELSIIDINKNEHIFRLYDIDEISKIS